MIYTASSNRVWSEPLGKFLHFTPRDKMRRGVVRNAFYASFSAPSLPPVELPIDWTKNGTLAFPYDGNNEYGDCFYAASCHQDNSMTGCSGTESTFATADIVKAYLALSGGDNGLDEQMMTGEWTNKGLAGNAAAKIFDHVDIDPTNAALMQSALYYFGGVQFQLSVPSKWINSFAAGSVWDAPAKPNPANGHAVEFAGVDATGRYLLLTWGSYCWITQAGIADCDPSAFAVASLRWFNPQGYAPNGLHYTQLAPLWQQLGGAAWPTSPFPGPGPAPTPTPAPAPAPTIPLSGTTQIGVYAVAWTATLNDPVPPSGS